MTESLGRWRQSLERCFGVFVHLCFLTSFTRLCPSGNVLSDALPPIGTLDECHTSLDSRVGNAMETVEHNALQCRRDKDASWRDTDVRPHLCVVLAFNQAWFEPGRRCVMVCDPPLQRLIALLGYTNLRRRGKSVNICRLRNEDGVACPGWRGVVDNTGGRNIAVVSARNTACRRIRRNCHRGRNWWRICFVSMWYLVRHNTGWNWTRNACWCLKLLLLTIPSSLELAEKCIIDQCLLLHRFGPSFFR